MTEEQKAQRLAEWLDEPPGTPPPEGMDPDVVATVYALRPDRAPSPRVSLDDIVAGVKEGPFATPAPTTAQVIGFPKKKAPSRAWMLPTLGLGLAAAAATLIVVPLAGRLQGPQDLAAVESERMAAPAPTTIPEAAAPAPAQEEAPKAVADAPVPADLALGAGPTALLRDEAGGKLRAGAGVAGGETPAAIEPAGDAAPLPPAEPVEAAMTELELPMAQSAAPPPPPAAPAPARGSAPSIPEATGGFAQSAAPTESARRKDLDEAAQAEETEDDREQKSASKPKKESSARAAAPTSSKSDLFTPPPNQGNAYTPASPQAGASQTWDYGADVKDAYADVRAVYDAAATREAAGDWTGAAATYTPLLRDARTDVAQDSALRAAKALRNAGDGEGALKIVQAALRRSSARTEIRARLLALEGDLLTAAGRGADAQEAYQEADKLNDER